MWGVFAFVKRHPRVTGTIAALSGFVFTILFLLNFPTSAAPADTTQEFGVTFTPAQAESFGLDWRQTYSALLDDLGVRHFRLVAYWNEIQPERDRFDFSRLDEQMDMLSRRGGKAILAVGRKVPRWPECHEPEWVKGKNRKEIEEDVKRFIGFVVNRYKNHPALSRWQIENEILFPFGICPSMLSMDALKREIAYARLRDSAHPIVVTDSGEWTPWLQFVGTGDVLGSSLYRGAYNPYFGYIEFPISPGWYQIRARILSLFGMDVIISELQAEPWGAYAIQEMTPEETLALLPPEKLSENIAFARSIGFSEVYLWGSEWWYWLKTKGDDRMWELVKALF